MDNTPAPIPSTSPQPEVSPTESPNRHWFLWAAIGLTFLTLGIAIGVFSARFFSQSQSPSQLTLTTTPTLSPTPTSTPDLNREPTGSAATAGWKTYTDPNYKFSINFPSDWKIQKKGDYLRGEYFVKIYPDYKTEEGYDDTTLYIGSPFVFSTSGAICANTSCKQHDLFQVTIAGNMYSSPILGEYMNGANRIIRSRFQFEIDSNTTNKPTVTANFHTIEDKDTFDQILSTFKFLD